MIGCGTVQLYEEDRVATVQGVEFTQRVEREGWVLLKILRGDRYGVGEVKLL